MRKPVFIFLLVLSLSAALAGCKKETEQDRIKQVVLTVQKSVEEKDIKTVLSSISKSYRDPQGNDREAIKAMLIGYFYRLPKITASITDLEITVESGTGRALFHAVLTSGSKTGTLSDLLPEQLGMYSFDVRFMKESGSWMIVSAAWEKLIGTDESTAQSIK